MAQKTPLYEEHVKLNGKIVDFAGWMLPIQYKTGIIAEHNAVRQKAGLFDVSHMGEFSVTGKDAFSTLQHVVTMDLSDMADGQIHYSPMCYPDGGVIDDLLIYRKSETSYLVVVNAANIEKDYEWIASHLVGEVDFQNISDQVAQVALQGPLSDTILEKVTDKKNIPEKYYTFLDQVPVAGRPCLISRTGYTGEDGFEIYLAPEDAPYIWNTLLAAGKEEGLIPCGLGARDTLRLEATLPLYGHELSSTINPYQAKLGLFVKLNKEEFIGKEALTNLKATTDKKRVCLVLVDRGIARAGDKIYHGDVPVGEVLSGTHSPTLGKAIATAIVPVSLNEIGTVLTIDVRGKMLKAEVVASPFYKRNQ